MDQFLSRLLDKYGLLRIVIAILSGFIVLWALAHFTAAPGGNVSVLWGLVQYTKNKPDTPIVSAKTESPDTTKEQQAIDQNGNIGGKASSVVLPVSSENISVMQGITKKNMNQKLQSLRAQRQLRTLEALESGRPVAETPRGTYFFVPIHYLAFSSESMVENLFKQKVYRFGSYSFYIEIHYPKNGSPIIIAFTSESDAARLTSPVHGIQKISLATLPWEKMPSLVSVPADKIISAKTREVDLSENNLVTMLDAEIK
jgi:hypothetical protein